jgi:hypothetical protein
VSEIVAKYGSNHGLCKAEVLQFTYAGKATPQVEGEEGFGTVRVVVDGFVLERFNTFNAANFYCNRVKSRRA